MPTMFLSQHTEYYPLDLRATPSGLADITSCIICNKNLVGMVYLLHKPLYKLLKTTITTVHPC